MGKSLIKHTWGSEFKSPSVGRGDTVSGDSTEAHGLATPVQQPRDPVSAKYSVVMYEILEGKGQKS